MNNIKKGALVKAWDLSHRDYIIGYYKYKNHYKYHKIEFTGVHESDDGVFANAIKIPPELAKQLEDLQ